MPVRTKAWNEVAKAVLPAVLVLSVFIRPAAAQSIDYGALQELFDEPVTTSATGKPQKSSEAPVAVEIISSERIRRMGVTSLPEVLNRMPGLTSWQATRHSADVGIRGQNAAYNRTLLVLLNGRQVYIDVNGYTDWSLIPVQLEEIRQIEIVKGPTTALYGFNAVSGVVNIVTYNPLYTDKGEAGVVGGTDEYGRVYGFNTAQLSDKASLRVSASLEGSDEFDIRSKTGYSGNFREEARHRKVMADGLMQLNDNTQLRLQASHADSEKTDAFIALYGLPYKRWINSGNATLISDTAIGQVQANLYTNIYHESFFGRLNASADNQVTVAQLSDLFKWGTDHTFRLQGEFRHTNAESDALLGPGAEISYDLASVGGMWNWAITPDIEWTNAVRLDHLMLDRSGQQSVSQVFTGNEQFNQSITDYSVNTGIVWKVTERDILRASYGRGIGAPSLIEFGIQFNLPGGAFPQFVVGDPAADTMVINHYEAGYERLLEGISGKLHSSVFYKRTENINSMASSTYFSGGALILQTSNIGDSETAGLELGLQGEVGENWIWDTSYVYQNTLDNMQGVTATTSPYLIRYENTIPHHVLKGHVGYAIGQWEADVYGELASEFDALVAGEPLNVIIPIDSYYTIGGRIGYTFENNLTLALMGSELAQARVANNYGLENERRLFVQLSKQF